MIVTAPIIGKGTVDDPRRPDTDATNWSVVEETDNEMTIEIKEG